MTTGSAETVVFATFDLDFSLCASALTPAAVIPGVSATSTVNVTAPSGFSGSIVLTCAVTPTPALAPTCAVSPNSVAAGTPATLTVNTTASSAAAMSASASSGLLVALWAPLVGLVGLSLGSNNEGRKAVLRATAFVGLLFAGLVFQMACGGSSSTVAATQAQRKARTPSPSRAPILPAPGAQHTDNAQSAMKQKQGSHTRRNDNSWS